MSTIEEKIRKTLAGVYTIAYNDGKDGLRLENVTELNREALDEYVKEVVVTIEQEYSLREARYKEILDQLEDLLECPYRLDENSIPRAGIESAPDYQVVGSMSVSVTRLANLKKALSKLKGGKE